MLDGNEVSCLTIVDFHSFHACASFLNGGNLLVTSLLCFCHSYYHTVCSPFYCQQIFRVVVYPLFSSNP